MNQGDSVDGEGCCEPRPDAALRPCSTGEPSDREVSDEPSSRRCVATGRPLDDGSEIVDAGDGDDERALAQYVDCRAELCGRCGQFDVVEGVDHRSWVGITKEPQRDVALLTFDPAHTGVSRLGKVGQRVEHRIRWPDRNEQTGHRGSCSPQFDAFRHTVAMRRVLAVLAAVLVWIVPIPVQAHTDLSSSTPADGSSVDGPLAEIVLAFTGAVEPIERGVAVAGADGTTQVAALVDAVDANTLVARFDPALPVGSYTAAWQARSSDTHVIDGSFSFGVTSPPSTTAPATTAPATTVPTPDTNVPETTVALAPEPTVAAPSSSAVAVASDDGDAAAPPSSAATPAAPTLDTGVSDGSRATDVGRWISFPAAVIALGMLVFAAAAFAGRRADLAAIAVAVRALGAAVAVGAAIELLGLGSIFGSVADAVSESGGRAALARLVGGAALALGLGPLVVRRAQNETPVALSAAVADDVSESHTDAAPTSTRWRPSLVNAVGLVGAAAIAISFAFDGHTVSAGPRVLHGAASVLHVLTAAAWAGGVVALVFLLRRRHQAGVPSAAVEMILRFSVIAMVALAAAAAAGVAMALMIDSDVAGYLDSEWGRLLAIKSALVVTAAGIGAYNHFVMLPRLEADPDGERVLATARRTLTVEAVALVGAALVSAALVAASTLAS